MKVLVTGGTGRIGSAVADALASEGARVASLCRTSARTPAVEERGHEPVVGDIASPERWLAVVSRCDAIVHAAASFDDRMGAMDTRLVDALLERLGEQRKRTKLLYTGGVWLFGANRVEQDESAVFDPPLEWQFMADNAGRVARAAHVHGVVVHPAIVPDDITGIPRLLLEEAAQSGEARLPCDAEATWPQVGRQDLAELYVRVLDQAPAGEMYIGASSPAVRVADLAAAVAEHLGLPPEPVVKPINYWMNKYGAWTSGYALSQSLSSDKARGLLGWEPRFRPPVPRSVDRSERPAAAR